MMKNKTIQRWDSKDIIFLRRNYKKLSISLNEIAKKLNKSKEAITHKANRSGLKRGQGAPHKRLPFLAKKPNKILAWLVGYLLGDGYLTTDWTIGMKSKDNDLKEFYIKNFERWSRFKKDEFVINQEKGKYNDREKGKVYNCKEIWIIRVCSKDAWQFFKKFKNDPLYCLKFFPKKYWKFLLRGLWDAEGHITPIEGGIEVGFSNSNEKILTLYEKLCLYLGYHPLKFKDGNEGKIMFDRMKEVQDFVERIGITVRRKQYKIKNRLRESKRKMRKIDERMEIYYKLRKLKEKGMQRKEIWEKIAKQIPIRTFDKWFYNIGKPGKNFKI